MTNSNSDKFQSPLLNYLEATNSFNFYLTNILYVEAIFIYIKLGLLLHVTVM